LKPKEESTTLAVFLFDRISPRHRLLLLGAVILISIFTSRVGSDPKEVGSWFIVVGAGALMYLADVLREVEEASSALVVPGKTLMRVRRDVISARLDAPRCGTFIAGVAVIVIGFGVLISAPPK
jgi:hypothetical protein